MTAKEFITRFNEGKPVKGLYLVPHQYVCAGFVPGSGGTLKVWGYYPHKVESVNVTVHGKFELMCTIVNKLGTVYEHNDFLTTTRPQKWKFDKFFDFFETEEEAIQECHERNRGKMGRGPCHNSDMTQVADNEKHYIAEKFY
jgi:hypothetical protein